MPLYGNQCKSALCRASCAACLSDPFERVDGRKKFLSHDGHFHRSFMLQRLAYISIDCRSDSRSCRTFSAISLIDNANLSKRESITIKSVSSPNRHETFGQIKLLHRLLLFDEVLTCHHFVILNLYLWRVLY